MVIKEEPFFSRVQPYDQWGAATTNPVLERYKKWLEEFKLQNQIKKHAKEEQQVCEDEKFQRVRDLTKKDREMIKKQRKNTNKQMKLLRKTYKMDKKIKCESIIDCQKSKKKLEERDTIKQQEVKNDNKMDKKYQGDQKKKYKTKPIWAMTKEEEEQHIKQDENLVYDSYINDLEVNVMLKALQQRVSDIKKQENWKDKLDQEDMKQEQREPDMYNTINQSLGKMMKPNQYILKKLKVRIQLIRFIQLIKKEIRFNSIRKIRLGQNYFQQKSKVSLEDRIAKHVADEILNQYKVIYGYILCSFEFIYLKNFRKKSLKNFIRIIYSRTCHFSYQK